MSGSQQSQPDLSRDDVDLVTIVAEDLKYLARPMQGQTTRTDVRLIATILRRLLLHGDYGKAWRLLGNTGEPSLRALDPEPMTSEVADPMWIHYAYAGGYNMSGAHHAGFAVVVIPAAVDKGRNAFGVRTGEQSGLQHSVPRTYNLSAYLRSTCIQIATNKITRGELLRYVANKLGGAHLDPKRDKVRDQTLSTLLDHGQMFVAGLPGPYFEVLTMAWDLARSAHSRELVEEVAQKYPPQMDEPNRIFFRESFEGPWNSMAMGPHEPGQQAIRTPFSSRTSGMEGAEATQAWKSSGSTLRVPPPSL